MTDQEKTGLGNYFVANYPPFSAWKPSTCPTRTPPSNAPPRPGTPLGLYLHIPFCRKRCKFCYFRVYTDKNARDVEVYLDALLKEVELYRQTAGRRRPAAAVRLLRRRHAVVPERDAAAQPDASACRRIFPWDAGGGGDVRVRAGHAAAAQARNAQGARRHAAEPGHRELRRRDPRSQRPGPSVGGDLPRLSAGRATSTSTQINIDLIAGMVGETWDNWRECVRKTIELAPESVTIYQMELPYNTVFSKELQRRSARTSSIRPTIADWPTKRAWVDYAFDEMAKAGYRVSSAYTHGAATRRRRSSSTATACGTGPTCSAPASRRSATSAACTCRTSIAGRSTSRRCNKGELPLGRALPVDAATSC